MKTISIKDIEGIRIGNAQNFTGGTGCTVILSETGMCAGLDVRGGGPASRESELLKPLAAAQSIHAVLLGGGSAFGLDAAGLQRNGPVPDDNAGIQHSHHHADGAFTH